MNYMNKTVILGLSVVALMLTSCNKGTGQPDFSQDVILENFIRQQKTETRSTDQKHLTTKQLRDYLIKKYVENKPTPNDVTYNEYGKVGCGYDFFQNDNSVTELESQENIKGRIIQINEATKSRININPLHSLDLNVKTYQDFNTDFSRHFYSIADSIAFGASASFGFKWLASASAKYSKHMRETTKQTETNTSKTVFAQVSALIKSKSISYTLGSIKSFSPENNLVTPFFIDYHLLSSEEIINQYGAMILVNYNLGGKAVASAGYTSQEVKPTTELKNDASKMISFSCSGLFGKVGANFDANSKIAIEEYKSIIRDYNDGHINIAYRGGDIYKNFPKNINFLEIKTGVFSPIDLNEWAQSVQNHQVMVSINKSGLIPIFNVIREKNISKRIKDYLLTGQNNIIDESAIKYAIFNNGEMLFFVMYNKYGDTIILDKTHIPSIGYEWWLYTGPKLSPIPFSPELQPKLIYGAPPTKNMIDLTSYLRASDKNMVSVEFCKIKNNLYDDDFTYLLIRNKETGKKVALSFFDVNGFNDYLLEEPEEFKYIKNLNYIDIYAL